MGGLSSEFYYDQYTSKLISSSNVAGVITSTAYPKVFRNNEHAILRGYVYSDASTETRANLAGLSWSAKIGDVGDTALITNSNNASFNLTEDWAQANVSSGATCFAINTAGTAVDSALGSLPSKVYACNINGNDSDGDDRTVAQFNIILTNTPD